MSSADKYLRDLIQIRSLKTKPKPKSSRNLSNFEEFQNVYGHVFDGGKTETRRQPAPKDPKALKVVHLEMPPLGAERAIFVPPSRKKSQLKSILKKQPKQPPPQPKTSTKRVVSQLEMLERQVKKESQSTLLKKTPSALLENTKQDLGIAEEQLRTIKALIQSKENEKAKQRRVATPVYKTNKPNRHSECFNRKYLTSLNALKLRLQGLEKKYFSKPQIVYKSVNDNFTQSSDIKVLYENVKYPEDTKIDSTLKNIISDLNGLIDVSVDKKSSQNSSNSSNSVIKRRSSIKPIGKKRNVSEPAVDRSSNSTPREFKFNDNLFPEETGERSNNLSDALNEAGSSASAADPSSSLELKDLLSRARSFMEKRKLNKESSNYNEIDYEFQRKVTPRNIALRGPQTNSSASSSSFGNVRKKRPAKSISKVSIEPSCDDAGKTLRGPIKSILKLPRGTSNTNKSANESIESAFKLPHEVGRTGFGCGQTIQESVECTLKRSRENDTNDDNGERQLEELTGRGSSFKLPQEATRTGYEILEEQLRGTAGSIFKLPRGISSPSYDNSEEPSKRTMGDSFKFPGDDTGYDNLDEQFSETSEITSKLPRDGSNTYYNHLEGNSEKSLGNIFKLSHTLSDKFTFVNTEEQPKELYYQDSVFGLLDDTKVQLETLVGLDQFNERNRSPYGYLTKERRLSLSTDDSSCYSKDTKYEAKVLTSDNESEQGDYFSGIIDKSEARLKKLMNIKQDVKEVHDYCEKMESITKEDQGEENIDYVLHGTALEKSVLNSSYLMKEFQLHPSKKFYGSDAPIVSKQMVQEAVKNCSQNSHLDMSKLRKSLDSALNNSIYSGAKF